MRANGPTGRDSAPGLDDVTEADTALLGELARRAIPDRVARLERRDLVERDGSALILAELREVRSAVGAMAAERRRDNTASRRAGRAVAAGLVWAAATFGAQQATGGRASAPPATRAP